MTRYYPRHLLSAILRTDLVPVPVSLELRYGMMTINKTISRRSKSLSLAKRLNYKSSNLTSNKATNTDRGIIQITAVLSSCVAIGYRRQKPLFLKVILWVQSIKPVVQKSVLKMILPCRCLCRFRSSTV